MKRMMMLLAVGALMAVMMVVSAAPVFAVTTDPIRDKGQQVSAVARLTPSEPFFEGNKGRTLSFLATVVIPPNPIQPPVT